MKKTFLLSLVLIVLAGCESLATKVGQVAIAYCELTPAQRTVARSAADAATMPYDVQVRVSCPGEPKTE